MYFRNLSIGQRATMIFVLLGVLVVGMGLTALYQATRMNEASTEVRGVWLPAVVALGDIGNELGRKRALTLRAVLVEDPAESRKARDAIQTINQNLPRALKAYEDTIQVPEDRALFSDFQTKRAAYADISQKIITALENGQRDESLRLINGPLAEIADAMMTSLRKLTQYNTDGANTSASNSSDAFDDAFLYILATLIAIMIAMTFIAILLTRSIVSPLGTAVSVAKRVANGDLTQDIQVIGKDEPAQLLAALQAMQNSLRTTISQIAQSSDHLASASEELHAVTEDASRSLHEQNDEIEQAASAVTQMTSVVEEVAGSAVVTAEASRTADTSTIHGREKVGQALASIEQLVGDVATTGQEIEQLAVSVNEISKVLDVIRSVAEQTNLLALNAAIEAARAGEAGRGFAVVADEVRGLAHRTQESTEQIEKMVGGIQSGTGRAVAAMQNSRDRADSTLDVAQQANAALAAIAESIAAINQRNLVIASASEQQAQAAREVDRNLGNIRDLSVQTSAGASETSAASQGLADLAVELNTMISRFRV